MKKTNLVILVLIIGIMLFFSCEEPDPTYTVRYEITGPSTAGCSVVYYNESGSLDSLRDVSIPWEKTIKVSGKSIPVGCSVSIINSSGTYTATVFVDGKEFKKSSSPTYASAVGVIN